MMNDEGTMGAGPRGESAALREGHDAAPGDALPMPPMASPVNDAGSESLDQRPPLDPAKAAITDSCPGATRVLKLVLTLRPTDGSRIQVLLAVGADGCDPLIRSLAVDGLPAALAAVPALVAEAEARWTAQPRYPAVTPPPPVRPPTRGPRPPAGHPPTGDSPAQEAAPPGSADPPQDRPVDERPADDAAQLSLFEQL